MLCKRKKYFLIRRCFYLALCITFVILNFFPAKFDSFAANQAITTFYGSYCLIAPNGDPITWGWNTNGLVGNGAMPVYPYWARKTLLSHVSEATAVVLFVFILMINLSVSLLRRGGNGSN